MRLRLGTLRQVINFTVKLRSDRDAADFMLNKLNSGEITLVKFLEDLDSIAKSMEGRKRNKKTITFIDVSNYYK